MMILLTPSKTQNFVDPAPLVVPQSEPIYAHIAQKMVHKVQKMSVQSLQQLYGVSRSIALQNQIRFRDFESQQKKPALFAFDGDVYDGLESGTLVAKHIGYIEKNLFILSGLYGILRAFDLIQAYRMEMHTPLKISGRSLRDLWRKPITDYLVKNIKNAEQPWILCLASREYADIIRQDHLGVPFVTVDFLTWRDGEYKNVVIYSKVARGALARFCIDHEVCTVEQVMLFCEYDYQYAPDKSSAIHLVFVREGVPHPKAGKRIA
jgi:uncharacterized protein